MKPRITVVPAAGLGTRMAPLSVAVPKELLPLGDRSLLQWTVEEALAAHANKVILVTSPSKTFGAFHSPGQRERQAAPKGGESGERWLELVEQASFSEAIQEHPLGLGHAILQAEDLVEDPYFFVQLPDEWYPDNDCLQALASASFVHPMPTLAVMEVPEYMTHRYGIVKPAIDPSKIEPGKPFPVADLVEKPEPGTAPSRWAIVGRYLLPRSIFAVLHNQEPGSGGEIQLTDGIRQLLQYTEVLALPFTGRRLDTGNHKGYQEAWQCWLQEH